MRIGRSAACMLLFATRKRVTRVKEAQLIAFFIRFELVCYVLIDCNGIFTYRIDVIPFIQKLAVSVCNFIFPNFWNIIKLLFPLISHAPRYAELWWYTEQHMHMVGTDFSFDYFYSFAFTQFSYYFSHLCYFLFEKYFPAVLWRKYFMVLNSIS